MKALYGLYVQMQNGEEEQSRLGGDTHTSLLAEQPSGTRMVSRMNEHQMETQRSDASIKLPEVKMLGKTPAQHTKTKFDQQIEGTEYANYSHTQKAAVLQTALQTLKRSTGPDPSESGKLSDVKLPDISESELARSMQKQTTKVNNFHDKFTNHHIKDVSVEEIPDHAPRSPLRDDISRSRSPTKMVKNMSENLDQSSLLDKEVDGLLNWANNLPMEEQFKASGSSFFKKGIL
jgi:hypothetical protein